MRINELNIQGVYEIIPELREDNRGGFFRYFCAEEMKNITQDSFVQMNHSFNNKAGTLRGMHYQLPPHSEGKLIRCIRGAVQDVFIDLREGSPTLLEHASIELSETNHRLIYLPPGIAHGFITLQDNTELLYHHTAFYNPEAERGIRFDDPNLSIDWTRQVEVISERDQSHPKLPANFTGI